MSRVVKNLSLDGDAVRRAEAYAERHGTSVSALVSRLLVSLPGGETSEEAWLQRLSPTVRRLLGRGEGATTMDDYRDYLAAKYR